MTELTISTADIAASIQKNLEGFEPGLEQSQVGRVLEVGDGIARVSGLPDAAVNELLQFESGTFGLALNLDEGSIGAVVLGEVDDIEEGQIVRATGDILSLPVGDGLLGRVVNALGEPIAPSSRFRASPKVPLSNCNNSFTAASGKPETLAMPSPTSSTRPTWLCSKPGSKPSRFFWIDAAISAVLIVNSVMFLSRLDCFLPTGNSLEVGSNGDGRFRQ
jgi:hypothetical protein